MKMIIRWDPGLPVLMLRNISQIPGVSGIAGEINAPVGSVWSYDEIMKNKELVLSYGLEYEVIESVKVHEDIKLGLPSRDSYIEAFQDGKLFQFLT